MFYEDKATGDIFIKRVEMEDMYPITHQGVRQAGRGYMESLVVGRGRLKQHYQRVTEAVARSRAPNAVAAALGEPVEFNEVEFPPRPPVEEGEGEGAARCLIYRDTPRAGCAVLLIVASPARYRICIDDWFPRSATTWARAMSADFRRKNPHI